MNEHAAALRTLRPWLPAATGLLILGFAVVVFADSAEFGYDYLAYDAAPRWLTAGWLPAEFYGLSAVLALTAPLVATTQEQTRPRRGGSTWLAG